jgi:hypothetical protein
MMNGEAVVEEVVVAVEKTIIKVEPKILMMKYKIQINNQLTKGTEIITIIIQENEKEAVAIEVVVVAVVEVGLAEEMMIIMKK